MSDNSSGMNVPTGVMTPGGQADARERMKLIEEGAEELFRFAPYPGGKAATLARLEERFRVAVERQAMGTLSAPQIEHVALSMLNQVLRRNVADLERQLADLQRPHDMDPDEGSDTTR